MEPRRLSLRIGADDSERSSSPITVRNTASSSNTHSTGPTSTRIGRRLASSSISPKDVVNSSHFQKSYPQVELAHSSYASYSLPCSIDTADYTDSMYGSPLIYGESFVDHQDYQPGYQEQGQEQGQEKGQKQGLEQRHGNEQDQRYIRVTIPREESSLSFHTDITERGPSRDQLSQSPSLSSGELDQSIVTARQSYTDFAEISQPFQFEAQPVAPNSSSSSMGDIHGSFIMPTISTSCQVQEQTVDRVVQGPGQGHGMSSTSDSTWNVRPDMVISPTSTLPGKSSKGSNPVNSRRPSSHSLSRQIHSKPRMVSPSPVPLHTRLSSMQKRRGRKPRIPEQLFAEESEAVLGGTYYSSRRHSLAEEDVCFPPESDDLDVDYSQLEEYLEKEKQVSLGNLHGIETEAHGLKSDSIKSQSHSSTSRLLSRRRSFNYGSISDPPFELPRSGYSLLFQAQDAGQTLEDDFRFTLFSAASATVHAKTLYELAPNGQTLPSILQSAIFWLDIVNPTDDEVKTLSQVFKIHPLTTEDILMEEGREKCEVFLNYYFVCFRTFVLESESVQILQPSSIYMLVFPNGVISFHSRPIPHCRNVRKRIRHLKEKMQVTPDWINYAMVDDIVDAFAPLIRQVEAEVDMIDELVLMLKEADQPDMLRRIGNCRKRVMSLLRLLTGKADVMKGLIKRYEGKMGHKRMGDIGLFMGDIQDHIITMIQNLSHCEKILSRSHSNYLAQINIEMTSTSNETNNVLTKLTALGSLMLPINLVTGLFGMNVPVPGQGSDGLRWFFSIVTAILCTASLFVLIARKKKLL